jgi:hypothetical protein
MKLRVSREMSWQEADAKENENEDEDEDKRREFPANIVLLQRISSSTKKICTN